jgi:hypothetical protein
LLIATYGCQTVNNTITPESSVANLQSDSSQVATERRTPQTSPAEKETTTTEKSADKVTGKSEEIEKRSSTGLQKNLLARWSNLGHGGMIQSSSAAEETTTTEKPADKVTGKSAEAEKESFVELEGNVIGKWMNFKETESLEFLDDGTIVIIDKRGVNPTLKGNYKFVDKDHLKVYSFGKGLYSKFLPPMSFKISISENEITLTDEPDGAATIYKRTK